MSLLRRTRAQGLTADEFDLFIAQAERAGLDPFRNEISAILLCAHDPARRRVAIVTTIDGLRGLAARSGDYRPMETAPLIKLNTRLKHPDRNPLGIEFARVKVWKLDPGGSWRAVVGEAYWEEFAPLTPKPPPRDALAPRGLAGPADPAEEAPERALALAPLWARMGRLMIAKCAEAQALRRGWPAALAGLHAEDELARALLDERLATERIGAALPCSPGVDGARGVRAVDLFLPNGDTERCAMPHLADRLAEIYAAIPDHETLQRFEDANREPLRDFWRARPGDALEIKRLAEARRETLAQIEAAAATEERAAAEAGGPAPLSPPGVLSEDAAPFIAQASEGGFAAEGGAGRRPPRRSHRRRRDA